MVRGQIRRGDRDDSAGNAGNPGHCRVEYHIWIQLDRYIGNNGG